MNTNYIVWALMAAGSIYAIRLAIFFITDAFEDIEE